MNQSARMMDFRTLNEKIRSATGDVTIRDCLGQRFIGSGLKEKTITVYGTPGNALGAYLDGAVIHVKGNAQDAVGDTMNDGRIVIHGNAGDTLGYAMRGGRIFVHGHAGYRTGIHMKEYQDKKPVIVIGGHVGSFLGEYQAGGIIIVLNIGSSDPPVGYFTGTGMHGGKMFIRSDQPLQGLSDQINAAPASLDDLREIDDAVSEFAEIFNLDAKAMLSAQFQLLKPNTKDPYKQLYAAH